MEEIKQQASLVDQYLHETVAHHTGKMPVKIYHESSVYFHWHEEYEFLLNTSPAICIISGTSYNLQPGDALLVHSHELHARFPDESQSNSMTSIVFHPDFVDGSDEYGSKTFTKMVFSRFISGKTVEGREIINLLYSLIEIDDFRDLGYEFRMQATLKQVFSLMIKYHMYTISTNNYSSTTPEPFQRALSYISSHYSQKITLEDLSEISHYNPSYIILLFRKYTLMSPIEYINNYRIIIAKELLLHTKKSIIEVADKCGFHNLSYFTRSFKAHTNFTPSEFRKHEKETRSP